MLTKTITYKGLLDQATRRGGASYLNVVQLVAPERTATFYQPAARILACPHEPGTLRSMVLDASCASRSAHPSPITIRRPGGPHSRTRLRNHAPLTADDRRVLPLQVTECDHSSTLSRSILFRGRRRMVGAQRGGARPPTVISESRTRVRQGAPSGLAWPVHCCCPNHSNCDRRGDTRGDTLWPEYRFCSKSQGRPDSRLPWKKFRP